jgi:hypothetical protein
VKSFRAAPAAELGVRLLQHPLRTRRLEHPDLGILLPAAMIVRVESDDPVGERVIGEGGLGPEPRRDRTVHRAR